MRPSRTVCQLLRKILHPRCCIFSISFLLSGAAISRLHITALLCIESIDLSACIMWERHMAMSRWRAYLPWLCNVALSLVNLMSLWLLKKTQGRPPETESRQTFSFILHLKLAFFLLFLLHVRGLFKIPGPCCIPDCRRQKLLAWAAALNRICDEWSILSFSFFAAHFARDWCAGNSHLRSHITHW